MTAFKPDWRKDFSDLIPRANAEASGLFLAEKHSGKPLKSSLEAKKARG
jgi:hypothetical protein